MEEIVRLSRKLSRQLNSLGHKKIQENLERQLSVAIKEEGTYLKYLKLVCRDGSSKEFFYAESQLEKVIQAEEIGDILDRGCLIRVAVFATSSLSSILMSEEVFGPVFCIKEIKSKEEISELIEANRYGLGASIFTKNRKLQEEFYQCANAGMVFCNRCPESKSELPWGGTRDSGFGRDCYFYGLETFSHVKTSVFKS